MAKSLARTSVLSSDSVPDCTISAGTDVIVVNDDVRDLSTLPSALSPKICPASIGRRNSHMVAFESAEVAARVALRSWFDLPASSRAASIPLGFGVGVDTYVPACPYLWPPSNRYINILACQISSLL